MTASCACMAEIIRTPEQTAAIEMAMTNRISILTGKPGTGKTTTLRYVLNCADDAGMDYLLCAPTGKAARRMSESTGQRAATIHSTLGVVSKGNDGWEFSHNEAMPLETDMIVIDEMSMVDMRLFHATLKAIDFSKTSLFMIGDAGQLPAIGTGAILRDLLSAGVPHIELSQIHRNSGAIVKACANIHAGRYFPLETRIDLDAPDKINLIHSEVPEPERIASAILAVVADRMPLRGYDPVWDVQVISPLNSRGALSCDSLNAALQAKLNPRGESIEGTIFRVGDKVIQTKNSREGAFMIVNGDIGTVTDYHDKSLTVEFSAEPGTDIPRIVDIPRKENDLLLAYCITCHRFQGSEAPVIILPVHHSFGFFCGRRWLYTAISRAKDICITVGQFASIRRMIDNQNDVERMTRLSELIQGEN